MEIKYYLHPDNGKEEKLLDTLPNQLEEVAEDKNHIIKIIQSADMGNPSFTFDVLRKRLEGFNYDEFPEEDIKRFDFIYRDVLSSVYYDKKSGDIMLSATCDIYRGFRVAISNYNWSK